MDANLLVGLGGIVGGILLSLGVMWVRAKQARSENEAAKNTAARILEEAKKDANLLKNAPYTLPVRRLDDVKAARELDLVWKG